MAVREWTNLWLDLALIGVVICFCNAWGSFIRWRLQVLSVCIGPILRTIGVLYSITLTLFVENPRDWVDLSRCSVTVVTG